jgi:hypothetical protein
MKGWMIFINRMGHWIDKCRQIERQTDKHTEGPIGSTVEEAKKPVLSNQVKSEQNERNKGKASLF